MTGRANHPFNRKFSYERILRRQPRLATLLKVVAALGLQLRAAPKMTP